MKYASLLSACLCASCAFGGAAPVLDLAFDASVLRTNQIDRFDFPLATNAFSLAFWVKPFSAAEHPCGSPWEKSASRLVGSVGSGYYEGCRFGLAGRTSFHPFFEVGGEAKHRGHVSAGHAVKTGAWTHVAWVWTGSNVTCYVNGERGSVHPFAHPWTPIPKGGKLTIGPTGHGQPPLPMQLENLRVWDRPLDIREIEDMTAARFPLVKAKRFTEEGRWAEARALYAQAQDWSETEIPACTNVEPKRPLAPAPATAHVLYVAPDGNDANDGTKARPLATWAAAAKRVRELKAGKAAGGATVYFRGGTYRVRDTTILTKDDSGRADFPIVYAACPGEKPVFSGYADLTEWEPVTDADALARLPTDAARAAVRTCDLRKAGVAVPKRAPALRVDGKAEVVDFFVDEKRLEPARYPNVGFLHATNIVDRTNGTFRADAAVGDLAKWAREPALMACGYFVWCWLDYTVPVKVDPSTGILALGRKFGHPIGAAWNPEMNYFLCNALAALDRESEWVLDYAAGRVYAWLPEEPAWWKFWARKPRYAVSTCAKTFLALDGTSHVEIRGLTFAGGRDRCVDAKNCSDLVFALNRIENFGGEGVRFASTRDLVFWGNALSGFGAAAMEISGGDRKTLTPSGIRLENNDVAFCSRSLRTYTPGLRLYGCGTKVVYNRFHDIPSSAFRLEGNDFLLSMNVIEDVVLESGDQGGVDIYNNPSYQGNVYSYNIWRRIGRGGHGQAGIRFDDRISGQVVYGNRFDACSDGKHFGAVQINGGKSNRIDNNVIVRCPIGVSAGAYAKARWIWSFTNAVGRAQIERDVNVFKPPYTTRYPGIEKLRDDPTAVNHLTRNVFVGEGTLMRAPADTDARRNWYFATCPDLDVLARETCFSPLPPESDIGPY